MTEELVEEGFVPEDGDVDVGSRCVEKGVDAIAQPDHLILLVRSRVSVSVVVTLSETDTLVRDGPEEVSEGLQTRRIRAHQVVIVRLTEVDLGVIGLVVKGCREHLIALLSTESRKEILEVFWSLIGRQQ